MISEKFAAKCSCKANGDDVSFALPPNFQTRPVRPRPGGGFLQESFMTGSRLMHWILSCLVAAIAFAGCTSDGTSSENTGGLNLNLELADGVVINEVDWTISGNDMNMTGIIDTSAPGATASVEVFGLPPGDGYLVELEATDETGEITCRGSAPFSVEIGVSTDIMVMLNCKLPARLGGVRVNGKFNVCAELAKVIVSPLQTSVGNDIDLSAQTVDVEGDAVTIVWSATGGSIADSNAADTTYTCGEVGQQSITVTVSDDEFEFCMDDWTVAVTCVEGEGDLCEGVTCDDTGNECTVAECNPANGQCETSTVDDGTECNGGAGMCMDGQCVDEDLCDGVVCEDDNECTTGLCNPDDGECSYTPVDDGTACNDGAGMCVSGDCMDADLCEGVTCDDTGNECTSAACNVQTGQCEEMDVPDGTECNGGSGACSAGECVDSSLCDGVDCSSATDCVLDGTCDPASGECIPGDNEPEDAPCTDGGVCDGSGACVECNNDNQCPDDGNDCTAAACEGNQCGQNPVMDGALCDFMGGDGICEAGTCVEAPACISPGDCDDGNVCTTDDCVDGECAFAPNDGASCDAGGSPGTCDAGACVGLCDGVDCSSASQCVQDGSCNGQTGACVPGAAEPVDTACTEDGGSVCDGLGVCVECNNDNQCPGSQICNNNSCEAGAVDPDPESAELTVGCTNNVTADISILPFTLNVDPGPIAGGASVPAEFGGTAVFSEVFLDAAQGAVPGGVTAAALINLAATVQIRTGGSLNNEVVLTNGPIPATCLIFPDQSCDPANDLASVPGSRGNTDCVPTGAFNPCQALVTIPTSTDCAPGGVCDGLGKTGAGSQCETNGFCVTGGLPLPLADQNASFTAAASGIVNFGFADQGTGATINGDGTYALPSAVFTAPPTPNEIKVNASGLSVALRCTMAVDAGGPDGVGVPDAASPTPTDLLITFDIQ